MGLDFKLGDYVISATIWGSDHMNDSPRAVYKIIEMSDDSTEYHRYYTVINIETKRIVDNSYLNNGHWRRLSEDIDGEELRKIKQYEREDKLKRICE